MSRRVVITGVGLVGALGVGRDAVWAGLCEGRSGLAKPTLFDASGFACQMAGEIRPDGAAAFSARDSVPKSYRKAVKVMARDTEIAVAAARLAALDAGLCTRGTLDGAPGTTTYPGDRVGCQIGAGLINAETAELSEALATATDDKGTFDTWRWGTVATASHPAGVGGMNNLQPLWMLKYLPNMLACHVTIIHGCEGPSNTITCAEASGLLSIGEGVRVIERGAADACFSGGAECKVNLMGTLRWTLQGQLRPCDDTHTPASLVRPFDPESAGTVLGEGGGIVILEHEAGARARNARVYARVAGFAAAHAPPPGYEAIRALQKPADDERPEDGMLYAMQAALDDAGLTPDAIDAIVVSANGVPASDRAEADAYRRLFGQRLARIPLVTLAPSMGELVAGRGGMQVGVAALMLHEQRLPARLHGGNCPPDLLANPASAGASALRHVLVTTGSTGGQCAAAVLAHAGPAHV